MKLRHEHLALFLFALANLLTYTVTSASAAQASSNSISFDRFLGTYYLSRDNKKVSLLTTDETIEANFPNQGYSGITRTIPTAYSGHSVNVRVFGVSDESGNAIPYTTSTRGSTLLLTTGNPDITLIGSQTFKLKYQTQEVVGIGKASDILLLDINGKGWNSSFNVVSGSVLIPQNLAASLHSPASCYRSPSTQLNSGCSVALHQSAQTTTVDATANNLAANQSLVVELSFASGTFATQSVSYSQISVATVLALIGFVAILAAIFVTLRQKRFRNL